MTRVSSFDVFDTCLVRAVGRPSDVHLLLGRLARSRGLIDVGADRFAHLRAEAEINAARNSNGTEFSLHDVYAELQQAMELRAGPAGQLEAAECEVEARVLRPVPEAARLVDAARRAGSRVAFLSDMYLPAEFVRAQLARHGLWTDEDAVMVSCETGAPKWTGEAFERLAAAQAVATSAILHTGDHERSDVIVPRRLGVSTRPFGAAAANRYELMLERWGAATDGFSAALAGASRLTRLEMPVDDADHAAIRDVAAGVVAPALIGFTLWVLRRAEQLGLRRLYFVARDGQILADVARRVAQRLGTDVEVVYIYGSRLSWWLPSVSSVEESEIEWAFATHDRLDVYTIAARLNLSDDATADLLARAGFDGKDRRDPLSADELDALRRAVGDPAFADQLVRAASSAREALVGYLREVGMLDGTRSALVDVGWIGRMHVSLAKVLRLAGAEPPVGLFFGISGGAPNGPDGDREAYYFDAHAPRGYASDVDSVVNMFDVFCTGFGGQTIGYAEAPDGSFRPRFAGDHDAVKSRWGLEVLQRAVAHFADVLVLDADLVDPHADVRAPIDAVVRAFLETPTAAEALAWGAFPREDESGAHEQTLAAPYRWRYLVARARNDTSARPLRYWKQGSVAITPKPLRWVIVGSGRIRPVAERAGGAARRLLKRR